MAMGRYRRRNTVWKQSGMPAGTDVHFLIPQKSTARTFPALDIMSALWGMRCMG